MRKRSITIHGHQTSVSLEDEFWEELAALAEQRQLSVNALVTEVDKTRDAAAGGNLSSALRVHVLTQLKRKISRA
jgi:predicted DNA-binding ribbon-helix-helix protein